MDGRRILFRLHFSGSIRRSVDLTFRATSRRYSVIWTVCEPSRTKRQRRSSWNLYSPWPECVKHRQPFFTIYASYAINAESFLFSMRFKLESDELGIGSSRVATLLTTWS